jgi:hypothetical protein
MDQELQERRARRVVPLHLRIHTEWVVLLVNNLSGPDRLVWTVRLFIYPLLLVDKKITEDCTLAKELAKAEHADDDHSEPDGGQRIDLICQHDGANAFQDNPADYNKEISGRHQIEN